MIALTAAEAGLSCVPFRVIELSYEDNDEVSVVGQIYSIGVYSDTAPQTTVTVPTVFPEPPSLVYPAPNVTAATATPYYETVNGKPFYGFEGTIDLPTTAEHFSALGAIHVVVIGEDGREVQAFTARAPFTGTQIAWRGGSGLRPDTDMSVRIEFRCENEIAQVTAAPFALAVEVEGLKDLGNPPTQPAGVVISEESRSFDVQTGKQTVNLLATISAPPGGWSTLQVAFHFWLSRDGGTSWTEDLGSFWALPTMRFRVAAPVDAAEQWCIGLSAWGALGSNTPDRNVLSNVLTVNPAGSVSASTPTLLAVSDVTYYKDGQGVDRLSWGFVFSNPSAYPNFAYCRLTASVVDDAGNVQPDGYGDERIVGVFGSDPGIVPQFAEIADWYAPPSTERWHVYRWRLYVVDTAGAATLASTFWSTDAADAHSHGGYCDVTSRPDVAPAIQRTDPGHRVRMPIGSGKGMMMTQAGYSVRLGGPLTTDASHAITFDYNGVQVNLSPSGDVSLNGIGLGTALKFSNQFTFQTVGTTTFATINALAAECIVTGALGAGVAYLGVVHASQIDGGDAWLQTLSIGGATKAGALIRASATGVFLDSSITIQAAQVNGILGTTNIPSLDASKVGSGTFEAVRIPNLAVSKITSWGSSPITIDTGTVTFAGGSPISITWANQTSINGGTVATGTVLCNSLLIGGFSAATQSWVTGTALSGYATQSWVGSQGYLTSAVLSGYATESWVNSQGFIRSIPAGTLVNGSNAFAFYQSYVSSIAVTKDANGFVTDVVAHCDFPKTVWATS